MARALQLAERGLYTCDPNPRVGCVLVNNGQIVGEGWHQRAGEGHAEVNALAQAQNLAQESTCYVTLEPCAFTGRTPPCADTLIQAGIKRIVAAMQDPHPQVSGQGFNRLRNAGIAVEWGLLEQQAKALNPGFIQRFTRQRPWIRCKLAASLDGRTALASGESQWITAPPARADVQKLRARSSAIVSGISTVLSDDPALNVRLAHIERQPLRVILDPKLETPPTARTLQLPGQVLILTAANDYTNDHNNWSALESAGAEIKIINGTQQALDLAAVAKELAERQCNEVHLECGSTLAGAFLSAGILDELIIYMAPVLLGDNARGLFHLPALTRMAERIELTLDDIRSVGRDLRITAYPKY